MRQSVDKSPSDLKQKKKIGHFLSYSREFQESATLWNTALAVLLWDTEKPFCHQFLEAEW